MTDETATALDRERRAVTAGTPGARAERDALATVHSDRLAQLRAVGDRLCFGRIELLDLTHRYIGRVGLRDPDGTRLLVDWRAPAAEPFYRATPVEPGGLISRRHLTTQGRTVTAVSDEVLDLDAYAAAHTERATVSEDGALMLALNARRTGRMHDIVATIQAEQDRVIRDQLGGVLVVQGGPGTGKTAVALHRAAYLLYAHRDRLANTGVLLVGPNERFLDYIEQVLPSLGETGVVLATPSQLYPGVDADADEPNEVTRLKGELRMARVLAAAVRARQRVPKRPIRFRVDGAELTLNPEDVRRAQGRARATHKPHNEARTVFVVEALNVLVRQLADRTGVTLQDAGGAETRQELLATLRESRDVRREINLLWMPITPERLLADLFADADQLAAAAPQLSPRHRALLARPRGSAWAPSDVALLDEAADLLGPIESSAANTDDRAARQRELDYAHAVLEQIGAGDEDSTAPSDVLSAADLAERQLAPHVRRSAVEHAAGDREWAYGHVIVDEAQELSAMQWRLLMRRCPSRSMTVVGDIAQTSSPAGATSWNQVLHRYVRDRWRLSELTVNYRTPGQVMDVATELLTQAGITATPVSSARPGDQPPTAHRIADGDPDAVLGYARTLLAESEGGTVAIIAPVRHRDPIAARVATDPPSPALSVLTPRQAKGLEFDAVLLVEPAEIIEESARGINDLYVALTRPTQRLVVLYSADLPIALRALAVD